MDQYKKDQIIKFALEEQATRPLAGGIQTKIDVLEALADHLETMIGKYERTIPPWELEGLKRNHSQVTAAIGVFKNARI